MRERLTHELLEFIVLHVNSVELLEVLTLVYSQKERGWTLEELDSIIRSNPASIGGRLTDLISLGLVAERSGQVASFSYSPTSEEMSRIGRDLVSAYQTRRVEIVELIYTKPMKEIVSFSNAFKMRGGTKKDG